MLDGRNDLPEKVAEDGANAVAAASAYDTTKAGDPRWAVVDHWWYPDDIPRSVTLDIRDEPISFA